MLPDLLGTHAFAGTAIIGRTAIGLLVCWFVCLFCLFVCEDVFRWATLLHTSISLFVDRLLVQISSLASWAQMNLIPWYNLAFVICNRPLHRFARLWPLPCSSCSRSLLCRRSLGAMISFRKWHVICGPFWLLLGSSSLTQGQRALLRGCSHWLISIYRSDRPSVRLMRTWSEGDGERERYRSEPPRGKWCM